MSAIECNAERRPLSEALPGMPINQVTINMIDSEVAMIEREREAMRDPELRADELALLHAFKAQTDRVIQHFRNKADWERTHKGIAYPWSVP